MCFEWNSIERSFIVFRFKGMGSILYSAASELPTEHQNITSAFCSLVRFFFRIGRFQQVRTTVATRTSKTVYRNSGSICSVVRDFCSDAVRACVQHEYARTVAGRGQLSASTHKDGWQGRAPSVAGIAGSGHCQSLVVKA